MIRKRPTLFIGSTVEGLVWAEAVHAELERVCDPTIWDCDVFAPGNSTLEDLESAARAFDFAVLILSPDDRVESRGTVSPVPRDNLVAELGMFIGSKGRRRTFALKPRGLEMKIPSDFLGVKFLEYTIREDRNARAAVRTACASIRQRIAELTSASHPRESEAVQLLREFPPGKLSALEAASEVWIAGVTLSRFMREWFHAFENRLEAGECRLKFVLRDPDGETVSLVARHSSEEIAVEEVRSRIRMSLARVARLAKVRAGAVSVRVLDHPITSGIFAFDPNLPSGSVYVEHHPYRIREGSVPKLLIRPSNGDWYPTYLAQFEAYWESGTPVEL